jgi:hypothetical protein
MFFEKVNHKSLWLAFLFASLSDLTIKRLYHINKVNESA